MSDFRCIKNDICPHGVGLALTFKFGNFMVEAVARRRKDGEWFYPTLGLDIFETEAAAMERYAELETRWRTATRDEVNEECFPDAGEG